MMKPKWMIWIYFASVVIAILITLAAVLRSAWYLLLALIVFIILTEGWRLFKPKDKDEQD